jgi:hypothetical protein
LKKSAIIILSIIFVLVTLLVAGILYLRQYTPKYNWSAQLRYTHEEPYDTKLLYDLLKESYDKDDFTIVHKQLRDKVEEKHKNTLLFFIGRYVYYDSLTSNSLKDFIYRGNAVCIASEYAPAKLLSELSVLDSINNFEKEYPQEVISTLFVHDSNERFTFHHQVYKDTMEYYYKYYDQAQFEKYFWNSRYTYLSYFDHEYLNFIKISYGKGVLFLYSTPKLLSNYYLATENGYKYTSQIFNEIGKYDQIIWDNSSILFTNLSNRSLNSENLLEFILSKDSLRWAWYLSIAGLLLFMIFRLKRQQKPIQVILPDKNASIEYAKAVGLLYYKTSSHQDLSEHMMKLFFNFIKTKYNLYIKEEKNVLIKQIATSSGLQQKEIEDIFNAHLKVKYNPQADASLTIKLHKTLEYFYKNCK